MQLPFVLLCPPTMSLCHWPLRREPPTSSSAWAQPRCPWPLHSELAGPALPHWAPEPWVPVTQRPPWT